MSNDAPIAIIGAGPAGLFAAEVLSAAGRRVVVYERMPSVARKFLMAGRGGLNLTHSEPFARFVTRYSEATRHLRPMLEAFAPGDL
ncbi:MAG: NAD(P)/FAD-dependent oxidoreductase, partial [Hyphomonadaceae bacterium]